MSQIPHSQLALKKRSTPVVVVEDIQKPNRKSNGLNDSNGHNNKNTVDKNEIDDEYAVIPIGREEIVEDQLPIQEDLPSKKKRGRKSKNSTDSRESSEFVIRKSEEIVEEAPQNAIAEDIVILPEASPKSKLTADALAKQRRSDRLQNASTIVNLSTVSSSIDQCIEKESSNDTLTEEQTERRVSGRRSTRPIDDIKFSYRSPNADDSLNATTNATIGSEIGDSILETPSTDRKRRIDSVENIESPKRSRLDLSALFNNFYSPVSILRSKFKRANIASTPKIGDGLLDDTENSIDISASEMKEIDLNEKSDKDSEIEDSHKVKMIVKPAKKSSCSIM